MPATSTPKAFRVLLYGPTDCDRCGADLDTGEDAVLIMDPDTGWEHYVACGWGCARRLLATFTEEATNGTT